MCNINYHSGVLMLLLRPVVSRCVKQILWVNQLKNKEKERKNVSKMGNCSHCSLKRNRLIEPTLSITITPPFDVTYSHSSYIITFPQKSVNSWWSRWAAIVKRRMNNQKRPGFKQVCIQFLAHYLNVQYTGGVLGKGSKNCMAFISRRKKPKSATLVAIVAKL